MEDCTGISKGQFPFKFLDCPITHTKKNEEHSVELIKKVKDKLQAQKRRVLPFGRKKVLIFSVLQVLLISDMIISATLN